LKGGIPVALIIMGIRATVTMAFNGLLLVTFISFPIVYLASVYGVMHLIGRISGLIGATTAQGTELLGSKIAFMGLCLSASGLVFAFLDERKRMILRE
jgi:hypothetical protein